jgi:nicotinate-nucleotide adenylyltransferase
LIKATMPPMGISSSEIRHLLKEGRSIRYMLPDSVLDFIQRNDLYES